MKLMRPSLGDQELSAVAAVLASENLTQGPVAAEFAQLVSSFVGSQNGLATSSCTTALHLALVGLGIEPGDEVIVPDFTFPATANVVIQQGAVPVLVDIDPVTYTIDPKQIEQALTSKTKLIMPVHTFGLCADMQAVNEIAKKYELPVLEDAACALGSTQNGKHAGTLGDVAAFSFHPRKIITTGEGGMLTTDNQDLFERLRLLGSHGGVRVGNRFVFEDAGFNYRMSDINAAIGVVQMSKLVGIIDYRRKLACWYSERLKGFNWVQLPVEPENYFHTFQSYVVNLESHIDRDCVIENLRDSGIEATIGTYSLQSQPYFIRRFGDLSHTVPHSISSFNKTITLPLHSQLDESEVNRVVVALENAVNLFH